MFRVPDAPVFPFLYPAMTTIHCFIVVVSGSRKACFGFQGKALLHFLKEPPLVGFQGQHVVASPIYNLSGNFLLGPHGINGNYRPLQVQ